MNTDFIKKAKSRPVEHDLNIILKRLDDLYHGMELGCCLEIIKHINNNDFEKAHTELQSQGHSGMSYVLVRSMVKSFHDRGKEFYEFIND